MLEVWVSAQVFGAVLHRAIEPQCGAGVGGMLLGDELNGGMSRGTTALV